MLRRWLLLIPLLAVAGALLGTRLPDHPAVVAVVAALAGLGIAAVVAGQVERRVGRVADRLEAFAQGRTEGAPLLDGGAEWAVLQSSVEAVGRSMRRQLDGIASERARVLRIIEGLDTGILLFADDGLAYANTAARTLFSLTSDRPRTPMQVLGVEALADAVAKARDSEEPVLVEVVRGDRALEARAAVTAAGEVALVVTDLTERRRVEAIRRDFVTNASHELKTPVAGIQALADSLDMAFARDPVRARRMIGRMQTEAARLAALVRDLLDLARLEEAAERSGSEVDVAEIVRAQIDRLAPYARERGIHLEADVPDHLVLVGVPADIRLIVGNLLENAVRYNRDGGRVSARVRRRDGAIVLTVADTGIGIPEVERERIFERFYRVDKGRSRAAGGTGLGLSLVRNAVQRHGGAITLDSILGQGSEFTVVLPDHHP